MTLPLRPILTLSATFVFVLSMVRNWGFFSPTAFLGAIGALALSWFACQWPISTPQILTTRTGTRLAFDAVFPVFAFCSVTILVVTPWSMDLMYADGPNTGMPLGVYPVLALVGLLVCLRGDWRQENASWGFGILSLVILLLTLTCRYEVLTRSPDPVIDVFSWLRDAADHLLAGRSPYSQSIVSPYGTERAAHFGVQEPPDPKPAAYPPVPVLLSALPRVIRADVRWANVIAELIAAVAIVQVGRRRNRPWLGLAIAILFLNLPRSVWIIEQAWYEPMLAGLFGLGFWLLELDGWRQKVGGIVIGLALTAKQFGLPLLLPIAGGLRRRWRSLLLGLVVAAFVILPFFVAGPNDLLDIVVRKHFARTPQYHSVTLSSAMWNWFNLELPRGLAWLAAIAVILSVSWRRIEKSAEAALPAGAALLAFCLFHTQGFPNYFYLCNYLWLLGFTAMLEPHASERASIGARDFA
jgi:hypothetical protein